MGTNRNKQRDSNISLEAFINISDKLFSFIFPFCCFQPFKIVFPVSFFLCFLSSLSAALFVIMAHAC